VPIDTFSSSSVLSFNYDGAIWFFITDIATFCNGALKSNFIS